MTHAAGANRVMLGVADAAHPGQGLSSGAHVRPRCDLGTTHGGPRRLARHVAGLGKAIEHFLGIGGIVEVIEDDFGVGIGIGC
jgi:hypothetical protein